MKKAKIIITLGPSTLSNNNLNKLKNLNISLFRINLSHTSLNQLKKYLKKIKKHNLSPICIDTEGAQIRTFDVNKRFLKINEEVFLGNNLKKNTKNINLYPDFKFKNIRINSHVSIGFEGLKIQIKQVNEKFLKGRVIEAGIIESNKGVHFQNTIKLNALTKKDIECIKFAKKNNVKIFALSFANNKESVDEIKKYVSKKDTIISKIESKNGFIKRKEIIKNSNMILIDRGDLSRYIEISKIPIAQKIIAKDCKKLKKSLYIATNLLETMIDKKLPTRAETNDIFNSLLDGANGLVLAAETAIGKNPFESIKFLNTCINSFQNFKKKKKLNYLFK